MNNYQNNYQSNHQSRTSYNNQSQNQSQNNYQQNTQKFQKALETANQSQSQFNNNNGTEVINNPYTFKPEAPLGPGRPTKETQNFRREQEIEGLGKPLVYRATQSFDADGQPKRSTQDAQQRPVPVRYQFPAGNGADAWQDYSVNTNTNQNYVSVYNKKDNTEVRFDASQSHLFQIGGKNGWTYIHTPDNNFAGTDKNQNWVSNDGSKNYIPPRFV